ncbi:phospholipase D-like domain-containing protein [Tropicimonas sp. IMCC34011]|uniref:phospholipase D-like domain-containing protein n=1 Tax=Tropicimonas sp. IMCC34011 TaxID=2248759 RepID=UPI000E21E05C|nr:phospholipase D-like domain-containing protein [Tropicimonas sp. IMCC34011]
MSNEPTRLIETGETAWRVEQADKLARIVDGADYFRAAKAAMLSARQTIMLIGWDFDTRVEFEPENETLEGPNQLGDFLEWLPQNRDDLHIYMLKWDLGAVQSIGRGMMPMSIRTLGMGENFTFRLDSHHPTGAAHHSKIVVIDDQIAFCGGIDMTAGRWDTRAHADDEELRKMPGGAPAKPWHDVTTAVSGPIAKALGDLARERWQRATGDVIETPDGADPIWPDGLEPTLTNVPVGISRTYPDYDGHEEVREIEALYLRLIAEVQDTLYVETQYLAAPRIAEAIAERLQEPDGPEFIIILPRKSEGWLRQKAMDGARFNLLHMLWEKDVHGHFGAFFPVTEGGAAIYVHAKLTVMDDRLARVGSSNFNNRSLGFDTECDLAVEASACPDPEAVRAKIRETRTDMLAEHLGTSHETVEAAITAEGSVLKAIEALRGAGRTLVPFTPDEIAEDDNGLSDNEMADPEQASETFLERLAEGIADFAKD